MTNTTESDLFSNPVTRAVTEMEARIAILDADALARVEDAATLDAVEWVAMGDKASRAMLAGIVDHGTAQSIHALHTIFHNGASLAQRMVFIMVMTEVMGALIAKGG